MPTEYITVGREKFAFDPQSKPLGQGAMGTVFAGRSMADNRPVAIKIVNPRFANIPSVRQRAREEAQLRFRHPNLIETVGLCEPIPNRGPIFIVSNYVSGISIDKHVNRNLRQFDDFTRRVVMTMMPVLDALTYLHGIPVYHLDIKPSNIMVEHGNSNVRLMDLGIAYTREVHEITSAGLLGTPGYAAPEQYVEVGRALDVDATTDLYEFAVTLYELLVGVKPDVEADLSDQNPNVMAVIEKAMSPDRENRYQSASELKHALNYALNKPPRPKWVVPAAIGGAAAAAIGVGLALLL